MHVYVSMCARSLVLVGACVCIYLNWYVCLYYVRMYVSRLPMCVCATCSYFDRHIDLSKYLGKYHSIILPTDAL